MSTSAMRNIIYRSRNNADSINILYDPTYSILDQVLFDSIKAEFYMYARFGRLNNVASLSDLDVLPYDLILTNSLHTNYRQISHMLHVPIVRYVGFEVGTNFNIEPNTYYICENAESDFSDQLFQIDSLDLSNYIQNINKEKDVCVIINYPELSKGMTEIVNLLNKYIKDIDIINTMEYPITSIAKYKCVIDPFPQNQYNMMYCAINHSVYICPNDSVPHVINKNMSTMLGCSSGQEIIKNVEKILPQYDTIDFDHDSQQILSKKSNWTSKISMILNKIKSKGYIK